jgi:hypothetical protein
VPRTLDESSELEIELSAWLLSVKRWGAGSVAINERDQVDFHCGGYADESEVSMGMKILIGYDGSVSADVALDDLRMAGLPRETEALLVSPSERPK